MFTFILGATALAGGGYWFYNKKNNESSKTVAINNFVFLSNLIYNKKPNAYAIRDDKPSLIFKDFDEVFDSTVEIRFDAHANLHFLYFGKNEDDNSEYIFSSFNHGTKKHLKCIYKNYSKVDITTSLFLGFSEQYKKLLDQALYSLAVYVVEYNELPIYRTLLSSFGINRPDEYIEHFLSGSKVEYTEDTVPTDNKDFITSESILANVDLKLIGDSSVQTKFEEIKVIMDEVLKHQQLIPGEHLHFLKVTIPNNILDSLNSYKNMNDKNSAIIYVNEILDNTLGRLHSINSDKDEFYIDRLKVIKKFSEDKKE